MHNTYIHTDRQTDIYMHTCIMYSVFDFIRIAPGEPEAQTPCAQFDSSINKVGSYSYFHTATVSRTFTDVAKYRRRLEQNST